MESGKTCTFEVKKNEARCVLEKVLDDDTASVVIFFLEREVSASKIQSLWRSYSSYSHARKKGWMKVLSSLGRKNYLLLLPFSNVRREWRTETENWGCVDVFTVSCIVEEAKEGLWGERMVSLSSD